MTFKKQTLSPSRDEQEFSTCSQCAQQRFCSLGQGVSGAKVAGDLVVSESAAQALLPQVVGALYGIPLLVLVLTVTGLSLWAPTPAVSLMLLLGVMALSMGAIVAIGRRWPVLRYEHLLKEKL